MHAKKRLSGKLKITAWLNGIAAWVIFVLMLLAALNIVLRKLLGVGITGTAEVSELLMIVLVFFALPHTEALNRNIDIPLLTDRLPPVPKRYIHLLALLAGFVFAAFLVTAAIFYALSLKQSGEVTMDLRIAKYPFGYGIAVGAVALGGVLFKKITALLKGQKP